MRVLTRMCKLRGCARSGRYLQLVKHASFTLFILFITSRQFYFASKKLLHLPWELDVSENTGEWGGMEGGCGGLDPELGAAPAQRKDGNGSVLCAEAALGSSVSHTHRAAAASGRAAIAVGTANLSAAQAAAEQLRETPATARRNPPLLFLHGKHHREM